MADFCSWCGDLVRFGTSGKSSLSTARLQEEDTGTRIREDATGTPSVYDCISD
jgi:hypothetical protein